MTNNTLTQLRNRIESVSDMLEDDVDAASLDDALKLLNQAKSITGVPMETKDFPEMLILNDPRHEKACFCHLRTTKAQISAFVVCCLDSVIPLFAIDKIYRLYQFSSAEQAGLSLTWSETPKTGFSRDEAQILSSE